MKNYKHFYIKTINNHLFGYLHELDIVENPADGDLYQINPDDVHMFLKNDLFRKEKDSVDYPFVNYDHLLNDIKLDLYHPKFDMSTIDQFATTAFFNKHLTTPITMIFYTKNYKNIIEDKKALNKIVDYVELNFSTNEKVIDKFKTFLKQFDIKLK